MGAASAQLYQEAGPGYIAECASQRRPARVDSLPGARFRVAGVPSAAHSSAAGVATVPIVPACSVLSSASVRLQKSCAALPKRELP